MRRNAIRLALAIVATSFLAACADMPTGPKTIQGPRFDTGTVPSTTPDTVTRTSNQGSQV
jgi:hypothetical protein